MLGIVDRFAALSVDFVHRDGFVAFHVAVAAAPARDFGLDVFIFCLFRCGQHRHPVLCDFAAFSVLRHFVSAIWIAQILSQVVQFLLDLDPDGECLSRSRILCEASS